MTLLTGPRAALLTSLVATLAVAGCGGPGTVDRGELEETVQTRLTETVGQEAPAADCPDELEAEKGAETRCTMDFSEQGTLGITVTVTAVDGDDVKFDIQADEELQPAS